mmetsp:Transcript_34728/g.97453  ORF Transcript_34728/g.97453 Transcript_34728/m.97453 type:complete len:176 (+) Transcript_34728:145-672(+)
MPVQAQGMGLAVHMPAFAISLAGGGKSRWKFGFGIWPAGPLSSAVRATVVFAAESLVDLPNPHCGMLRALDTTCRPRELSCAEVSKSCAESWCWGSRGVLPNFQDGAEERSEFGCEPSPGGIECEPGPTYRGVEVAGGPSLGTSFGGPCLSEGGPVAGPKEYSGGTGTAAASRGV